MPSTQENDAFLSLLCSQREILKRLSREKNTLCPRSRQPISLPSVNNGAFLHLVEGKNRAATHTDVSTNRSSFGDVADPLSLMNQPIIERHPSRLQSDVGDEKLILPKPARFLTTDIVGNNTRNKERCNRRKSERRNSLGLLASALLFDEDSMASSRPQHCNFSSQSPERKQNKDSVLLFSKVKSTAEVYQKSKRMDPFIDLIPTLKGNFESFVFAMDKSTKSQQDIHNWDRKMGLKRSHSKTMRLSMRSRKKLRTLLT